MNSLDDLNDWLGVAAFLLDRSTTSIQESLDPNAGHVRRIAVAFGNILDIQHAIYELRPDLKTAVLRDLTEHTNANLRLADALAHMLRCGQTGQANEAERELVRYISSEPSALHRKIAERILAREKSSSSFQLI